MQSSGESANLYPLSGEEWSHFEVLTSAFIDYNAVPIKCECKIYKNFFKHFVLSFCVSIVL